MKLRQDILLKALLALTILLVVFVRLRLLNIPLERDEGEYAYAGQLIKQGIPPYSGVYNMKFPGAYVCYFLIELLFGQTIRAIHFGAMLVNLISAFFIFHLSKKLFDNRIALISTVSFLLMSLSDAVEGLDANAEIFVILFALPGISLLFSALEKGNSLKLFISGILLGLAVIMKQHGAAFVIFGGIYLLYYYFFEKPPDKNRFLFAVRRLLLFTVAAIVPFLLTIAALALTGVLENFWWLTFQYAREYVSQNTWKDIWDSFSFRLIFKANPLLWVLCLAGIISIFLRKHKTSSFFLLAFALFSFLAICPGFYFRPHYFILILPASSLLIGAALQSLLINEKFSASFSKNSAFALLSLSILSFAVLNFSYLFKESTYQISKRLYPKEHFNEMVEVANHIKENSSPTDAIAVMGSEPEIYFYSQRHSATGYIYCYPLIEYQKYSEQMQSQYFAEIENANPEFVVLINTTQAWWKRLSEHKTIFDWSTDFLSRNYSLCGIVDSLESQKPIYTWNVKNDSAISVSKERIEIYCRN